MPRKARTIHVELAPIEVDTTNRRCPWIRATEILIRALKQNEHLMESDNQSNPPDCTSESHIVNHTARANRNQKGDTK